MFENMVQMKNELNNIGEVAGFLWERNWAECNGGNISVNITEYENENFQSFAQVSDVIKLKTQVAAISGDIFYVSGTGKSMRDIAKSPEEYGVKIRISDDGRSYSVISEINIPITSELPSHLAIQNYLKEKAPYKKVVLHTHPTELIALTHCQPFLKARFLTKTLWSMIPETRIFVPKGLGIVHYTRTGSAELANATLQQLKKHDVVMWEKHGVLAVGEDVFKCFDVIDALNKSAQIYLYARSAGYEPQGLSEEQMNELAKAFKL
jgi:rhamnulose-1-phosphate aldolase